MSYGDLPRPRALIVSQEGADRPTAEIPRPAYEDGLRLWGMPVYVDPLAPPNTAYILNTDYMASFAIEFPTERKTSMFNRYFLKDLAERAIATAAQAALSIIGTDALFDSFHADWVQVASVAAGGAVLAVLKGIVASKVGEFPTASLVD